ncbi:MAG: hypothetical protein CL758_01845 [Chloroflexi bacterium]|nr:hypothetical protein [Chloroflexota bacterium]|tara:strand:- start:244 stop:894 length:651 start_codon:yes stop_codon:yes gene_type:complete
MFKNFNNTSLIIITLFSIILFASCYNSKTGEVTIGESIKFEQPALMETGSHRVEAFTEMHFQPSYRSQESPRLLPPKGSVPITGASLDYLTMDISENSEITIPKDNLDFAKATDIYNINCLVCHGSTLKGIDEPDPKYQAKILAFYGDKSPLPPNLTKETYNNAELFAYISAGGRQGYSSRKRGKWPQAIMPEFGRVLTDDDRWQLVQLIQSYNSN